MFLYLLDNRKKFLNDRLFLHSEISNNVLHHLSCNDLFLMDWTVHRFSKLFNRRKWNNNVMNFLNDHLFLLNRDFRNVLSRLTLQQQVPDGLGCTRAQKTLHREEANQQLVQRTQSQVRVRRTRSQELVQQEEQQVLDPHIRPSVTEQRSRRTSRKAKR